MSKPILWIVIPCYNEEQVLPITAPSRPNKSWFCFYENPIFKFMS